MPESSSSNLVVELLVPELPGVQHDWLLFDEGYVQTGTFGKAGALQQVADETDASLTHAVVEPAEAIGLRTNTDGYVHLSDFQGIEGVWSFQDQRADRPAFVAKLAVRAEPDGSWPSTIGFELKHVTYRAMAREKDAALALSMPERALLASSGPTMISDVVLASQSVPVYERLDITAQLSGNWVNPFDPEDVRLDARVTTPNGQQLLIPGFLNRAYTPEMQGDEQVMMPAGPLRWGVRYTPRIPGNHQIQLILDDGSEVVESDIYQFEATEAMGEGFIRIAEENPYYFSFDNGDLYFPIGMNIGWSGRSGTADYEMYMSRLAEHEANFVRIWLGPTFNSMGLERGMSEETGANGLGWIDLAAAAKVEQVLDIADRHGIRVMVAIESFSAMRDSGAPRHWHESPYNVALGGPLRHTGEILTDPTARTYFRQRLRYLVARFGGDTTLLNWELWNEVNGIDGYDSAASEAWHREMAALIKDLDVYDQPVATSFWINHGDERVDRLPELDFVQTHIYGAADIPEYFIPIAQRKLKKYAKPHLFGEYGVDVSANGSTGVDLEGVHLHNGHWAALFSGSAGGPMVWWWDNYVDPNNLYNRFTPLARFVRGMPLHEIPLIPIRDIELGRPDGKPATTGRRSLRLSPAARSWDTCDVNRACVFEIDAQGRISEFDVLPAVLHGAAGDNKRLHNPSTFELTMPEAGTFTVFVEGVSGWSGAHLEVRLNGEVVIDQPFPDNNGDDKSLIRTYDGGYSFDLPPGDHVIEVINTGLDWMAVDYEISNYLPASLPGVDAWASRFEWPADDGLIGILWLRDQYFTWRQVEDAKDHPLVPQRVVVGLPGFAAGRYRVVWHNSFTGEPMHSQSVRASDEELSFAVPEFVKSLVAKIYQE